jgi:drug/metabolite transporter (DMT)-like permease
MLLKLFALQYAPATTVATIVRLNLVFSVLGGGFVFKEKDTIRRLLAALMILAGNIGVVWFG